MADDIVKVKIDTDTTDSIKSMVKYTAVIGGATLAIKKAIDIGADLVNHYKVQEQAERKLAGVVKATGGAAGLTSREMIDYAQSLQKVTTFGDETIISAQAILATFKNVKDEAFMRTTEAALDMSTVLGTDLNSAMVQLGKAVNDPVLGVTALNRAGIQFTDTQKETIKALQESGDLYAAQDIVLKEVEGQMGGTARAMKEGTGTFDTLDNVVGDLKEELGRVVTKGLQPFTQWMIAATNAATQFIRQESIASITSDIYDLEIQLKDLQETGVGTKTQSGFLGFSAKDLNKEVTNVESVTAQLEALRAERDQLMGEGEAGLTLPPIPPPPKVPEETLTSWERKAELARMNSDASIEFYENEKAIAEKSMDMKAEEAAFEQEMFEQRLNAASTFFDGWAALAALGADQSTALAIAFKTLAAAEAGVNSYLAYTKALASAPWPWNIAAASGVLAKGLAAQAKIWATDVPKFANGGSFVTSGPQMIMVGDNGTGRERVDITPQGATSAADIGMVHNTINLDGKVIADFMTKASRDGRSITYARSIK